MFNTAVGERKVKELVAMLTPSTLFDYISAYAVGSFKKFRDL
jgi:hypothetical protein